MQKYFANTIFLKIIFLKQFSVHILAKFQLFFAII